MTTRLLCALLLLPVNVVPAPAQSPRGDALGDPLPAGAVARLGTARLYHPCDLVAFSPDGRQVITVGRKDPWVRFWDVATGKEVRQIHCPFLHRFGINGPTALACSPDGS